MCLLWTICWLCKVWMSWVNIILQLYIQFIFTLVWGTDNISGKMYMFIITKIPYILHPIIISSCCILWWFIIYFFIWMGSIKLVLFGCYPIWFHVPINSLSQDLDSCHCLDPVSLSSSSISDLTMDVYRCSLIFITFM